MSEKTCIIAGTSLLESELFSAFDKISANNSYGKVNLYKQGDVFYIQRHEGNTPPHQINYRSYTQALADAGIKKIISISSVGSLKKSIKSPSLLLPYDFISPWQIPTFYDNEIKHITPAFSEDVRKLLAGVAEKLNISVYDKGVYLQAKGPRLETKAEIRMFARFADVVGMTMGSEITLANEKNIEFACLCTVDNFANGIQGSIDYDNDICGGASKNQAQAEAILKELIERNFK